MLLKTILVLVAVSFCMAKANEDTGTCSETVRETEYGSVCGIITTSRANSTVEYFSFKGIPYAAPPIGDLRFQEPEPPEPWTTTKCAKKYRSVCMQWEPAINSTVIGSEDCLYLDVYISITAANGTQMPVLVYFHGGHWITGSVRDSGPDYLMEESIISVEIQFRLNVFGFFTTLDDNAKGNLGLKDQVLALQWIQNNIENFNGDPTRVTISGSGSGGMSAIYHMLSPLSTGLFSRVISLSASTPRRRHPLEITAALLRALDINSTDTAEQVAQLQAIDAETIITTALNYSVVHDPATRLIPEGMNLPEGDPCINTTLNNITARYFPDRNYTNPNEWIPYVSSLAWDIAILECVYVLQSRLTVYFYYFSYVGSRNSAYLRPRDVALDEDTLYFRYPQGCKSTPNETAADRLTRKRVITMWINFVYKGNPTPRADPLLQNVRWPALTRTKQNYLNISSTLTIGSPLPKQSELPFWTELHGNCSFPDPNPNNEE